MNITIQFIDKLLQQADIEGLIQAGAPSDEYFSEAEIIYSALAELDKHEFIKKNVTSIVSKIWKESFNLGDSELLPRLPSIISLTESIMMNENQIS